MTATPVRPARPKGTSDVDFLITNVIRAVCADTWSRAPSFESSVAGALDEQLGLPAGSGIRLPDESLYRDLSIGSAGALASDVQVLGFVPALRGVSVALKLGAQVETVRPGSAVAIPRGASGATTTWLSGETAEPGDGDPAFGRIINTPRILSAHLWISRQLLLQGENAEDVVRTELRRAAAAALDAAILAGAGNAGEPLGIVYLSGAGAFTATSLDQAALRNAQLDVALGAEGRPVSLVTTPTVADLLARRPRVASSDRMLWEGSTADGTVEGVRALSTTNCPTGCAVVGDFSSVWIAEWSGGLVLEVDPFTRFKKLQVGLRLLMPVDVAILRPAAFSVATGVS